MATIFSYGVKNATRPATAKVDLNCINLPNPHSVASLRGLTGLDEKVRAYVLNAGVGDRIDRAMAAVLAGKDVAFHCLGGKHRSVVLAEETAARLRDKGVEVQVQHLSLA